MNFLKFFLAMVVVLFAATLAEASNPPDVGKLVIAKAGYLQAEQGVDIVMVFILAESEGYTPYSFAAVYRPDRQEATINRANNWNVYTYLSRHRRTKSQDLYLIYNKDIRYTRKWEQPPIRAVTI